MLKIKIVSNPYEEELTYYTKDSRSNEWERITYENSQGSHLFRKELVGKCFAEIANKVFGILYSDYGESPEKKLQIEFEGTGKEYEKALSVVKEKYDDKIEFLQGQKYLFNVEEVEAKLKVCIETLCDANLEKIDVSILKYITELNLLKNNQEHSKFYVVNEMRIKIKQLISKLRVRFSEVDKEKDKISSELKVLREWKTESADYLRNEKFRIRDSYEKIILDTSGYMDPKQLCKDEKKFCYDNEMWIVDRDDQIAEKYAGIINNWFAERYRKLIGITITRSELYLNEQGSNLIGHLVRTIRQLNIGGDACLDAHYSLWCCFDADNVYESCNNFLDKEDLIHDGITCGLLGQDVSPVLGFENAVEKKLSKFEQEMRMKIFRRHWPNLSEWLEEQYSKLSQFVNEYGGEKTRDLHKKYADFEQEHFLLDQCLKVLNDCESDINHKLFQWYERNN